MATNNSKHNLTVRERAELEELIDRCGLCNVLEKMAVICQEKADKALACPTHNKELCNQWGDAADAIFKCSGLSAIINISPE